MKVKASLREESYKYVYGFSGADGEFAADKEAESGTEEIALFAARGDEAACQLLLTADAPFSLTLGKTPYLSRRYDAPTFRVGCDLSLPVEMYHEGCLTGDDSRLYADLLNPEDAKEYEAHAMALVYLRFPLGRDAAAGVYRGKIRLFLSRQYSDEEVLRTFSVTLTVYPYALTARRDSPLYLDLWQYNANLARHSDVPLWSDAHFKVMERYLSSLGTLGQKALTIPVSEAPWDGHNCAFEDYYRANLYEYSMIPVTRHIDGTFSYDFTIMQRYIDIGAKYGIKDELSLYGIVGVWCSKIGDTDAPARDYPDALRVRYLDERDGSYRYMHRAEELDGYLYALYSYFVESGQIDRVRVSADEPSDADAFRKSLLHVRALCPRFRFKAAIDRAAFIGEFGDLIDDFSAIIDCVKKELPTLKRYRRKMKDSRFSFYVCCKPKRPNTLLASPLTESYLMGIFPSYLGLDGFLRWNYTAWTDEPREDVRFRWPAGDMFFVYPGHNGAPLLTLRYFALLRGLRFYDLLEAYRKTCGEDAYRGAVSRLLFGSGEVPADFGERFDYESMGNIPASEFDAVRRELLATLSDRNPENS